MKIYHAQVNHLENPMGFRMERTVFSWKVKDAEGKKQSYARIRVASDAAMEHLLFDSGEDGKASSLFYPVKLDLEPRTRYYWNVEAGSDAGAVSYTHLKVCARKTGSAGFYRRTARQCLCPDRNRDRKRDAGGDCNQHCRTAHSDPVSKNRKTDVYKRQAYP